MPAGSQKCKYIKAYENVFRPELRRVAHIFLGGVISCPVCSRPGSVIIHKLEYPEVNEHEKVD